MSTTIVKERPSAPNSSRVAVVLIAALLLIGFLVWAYVTTHPQPVVVVRRDIIGQVPITGTIVVPPTAQAVVYSTYRAPVAKIDKSVGDPVNKGNVIVELALPNVDAALQQAKQNLKAAETAYANAKKQYDGQVIAAQQRLNAALSAANSAAQTTTPSTESTDTSPAPTTSSTTSTTDVEAARQALTQAQTERQAGLAPYLQQLEAARLAYEEARAGKKQATIRAPITGTIVELNAQPGQEVGVDQKVPVARIIDLSAIQVAAPLDPKMAVTVKPGMPVKLTFKELPGKEFEGKVTSIVTQTESKVGGLVKNEKYVAIIDFKNAHAEVKPSMTPSGVIMTGRAKDALVVPNDTITVDKAGRTNVKVQRGREWVEVPVEVGVSDGKYTQIKAGLQPNEVVAVTPNILNAATR